MESHQAKEHGAEERAAVLLFFFSSLFSHFVSFIIYSLPLCNPVILSPSLPPSNVFLTPSRFSSSHSSLTLASTRLFCHHEPFLTFLIIGSISPTCPDIPEDEAQYWTSKLERINTMRIHDEVSLHKVLTNLSLTLNLTLS